MPGVAKARRCLVLFIVSHVDFPKDTQQGLCTFGEVKLPSRAYRNVVAPRISQCWHSDDWIEIHLRLIEQRIEVTRRSGPDEEENSSLII